MTSAKHIIANVPTSRDKSSVSKNKIKSDQPEFPKKCNLKNILICLVDKICPNFFSNIKKSSFKLYRPRSKQTSELVKNK